MDWTKVVTDPLGLVGFALALVFGFVARTKKTPWVMPVSFILATVCVFGGLFLAYQRATGVSTAKAATAPDVSIKIDRNEQNVGKGNAVSGVAGNLSINAPVSKSEQDKKADAATPPASKTTNSIQIGTNKQDVKGGNAVSGVGGNVTIYAPNSQGESKSK